MLFAGNAFLNYRVAVTNNSPSFATNARISEAMTPPAAKRIRFVCDTTGASSAVCNAPSLCSVVNVTLAPGAALPTFFCAVPAGNASTGLLQGELAATRTKNIFLRFETLDQPAPNGDIFNNRAAVTANEPDSFPANDASDEQTTLRQRIDLALRKSRWWCATARRPQRPHLAALQVRRERLQARRPRGEPQPGACGMNCASLPNRRVEVRS